MIGKASTTRTATGAVFLYVLWACCGAAAYAQQTTTPATCTAEGRNYSPGEIACIPACHGQQRLARCERTGGGVQWTSVSDSCPNAMISLPLMAFIRSSMLAPVSFARPDRPWFQ